ncbi:universal stress protein [Rheinheimera sp.]|uniref:universal stress protein n=1 Tax=Rheinheimera sp. TaxID=1869214 RepID=UPI0027BA93E3|nr:universal stress protein [Rheinheimera sp.]
MRKILIIWEFTNNVLPMLDKAASLLKGNAVTFHFVAFISHDTIQKTGISNTTTIAELVEQSLSAHQLSEAPHKVFAVHQDNIANWVSEICAGQHYDLVIKSGHRTEQLFYTPTDWQLIRHLPIPLLLVSNQPQRQQKSVLATVDLLNVSPVQQELNRKVTEFAWRIARHDGATLHLVQVVPVNPVLQDLDLTSGAAVLEKSAPALLAKLEAFAAAEQLTDYQIHLQAGVVEQEIQQLSKNLKASLVVMGSIGRKGLSGLLLGNTAEKVLTRLHTDVLVVKPAP